MDTRYKFDNEQVNSFVKRIIYSGPKTIVFWTDGTKTIVSCGEGETFDEYYGFCAAFAKKMFGSTSRVKKLVERKKEEK